MSSPFDFDRRLTAWLDDEAPMRAPDALLGTVVERAAQTRRRPAWATFERWISMETRAQLGAVPRGAIILVTLALLTALLGVAIAIGASPAPKLPEPLGLAKNGLIAYDSNGDIWVTNVEGTIRHQLTNSPETDEGPIFSPDGRYIAFWSKADQAGRSSLMVMDEDGRNAHALVEGLTLINGGDAGLREPSWSHDSQRLAYPDRVVTGLTSVDRISVVSAAGGEPLVLASPADGPTWEPGDARIAYRGGGLDGSGGSSPVGVYLVDSTGGQPQPLVTTTEPENPAGYIYPGWSLDGRITYSAVFPDVFVTTVADPSPQAISHGTTNQVLPVWSPDSLSIAYNSEFDAHKMHLVVSDPEGVTQTELVHPPVLDRLPTWSPDGKWLLGYLSDGTGMVVVDPSEAAQPVTVPASAQVGYSSWQRLAP